MFLFVFTNTFTAAWHCNRPQFKRAFPTTAFRKLRLQLFGYIPFVLPCFGQHCRALPTRSSASSLPHSLPPSLTPLLPRSLTPFSLPPSRPLSPTPHLWREFLVQDQQLQRSLCKSRYLFASSSICFNRNKMLSCSVKDSSRITMHFEKVPGLAHQSNVFALDTQKPRVCSPGR